MRLFAFALVAFAFGCDGGPEIDAGREDGGRDEIDAGTDAGIDAGSDAGMDGGRDSGADAGSDAGMDAGVTPAGVISGTCGVLDDEITTPEPYYIQNEMFFAEEFSRTDPRGVSPDGRE